MKLHKLLAAFAALSMASAASHAVTLGEIRVNSYLSQPLSAEIEIVGLAEGQQQDLRLRIANDRYLERMGIDYDPFLRDLRFDVMRTGTQWVVRARSSQPVREPFLELPLHMSWRDGQLIRKYTLLFDPPSRIRPATAETMRSASAQRGPAPVSDGTVDKGSGDAIGADTYGPVRPGESLWPIARELRPRGVSTRQMMIALLRANPEAFINGDMNKLRAGATLHVPLQAFIEQVNSEPVTPQAAQPARPRLTDNVGASPRELQRVTDLSEERAKPAPVETAPAEPASDTPAPAGPVDRLRIVSGKEQPVDEGGEVRQELLDELLLKQEELETNRLNTSELAARISRLEEKMSQMRQLVVLKDAQIERLKSEVLTSETPEQSSEATLPVVNAKVAEESAAGTSGETSAAATAAASAEKTVTLQTDRPVTVAKEVSPNDLLRSPYLWAVWGILGMLGLTALFMVWRRPRAPASETEAALPAIGAAGSANPVDRLPETLSGPAVVEESPPPAAEDTVPPQLQDAEIEPAVAEAMPGGAAATTEALDEDRKLLDTPTESAHPTNNFDDDDIEAWAKELEFEPELSEVLGISRKPSTLDEDVPGVEPERNDRLAWADLRNAARNDGIELELIDRESDAPSDASGPESVVDLAAQPVEALEHDAPDAEDPLDQAVLDSVIHLDDPKYDAGATTPAASPDPACADEWHDAEAFSMNLDLARAYLEIGYQEEAKGMLDQALEKVQDEDQRRQIEALLKQAG